MDGCSPGRNKRAVCHLTASLLLVANFSYHGNGYMLYIQKTEPHKPHLSGIQNNVRITTTRKSHSPENFSKFEKFPDRQKHIKPHVSGIQNNVRITITRKSCLPVNFSTFEKFPDRQKHIKPHVSGIQNKSENYHDN